MKPRKDDDKSDLTNDRERTNSHVDTQTQSEKFEAAARELGCDPDEDRFKGVLRKLAKPKG